jgi:hypothetical protein
VSKAPQFESAIVGALIECNGSDLPANLAHLQENAPESFDDLRCGQVAAAIRTLGNQGRAVHAAAIVELVKFEGASVFVSELVANALPLELAELEAAEVFERYRTRRMATLFDEGAKALLANPNDANSISGHVRAELEHIEHGAHWYQLVYAANSDTGGWRQNAGLPGDVYDGTYDATGANGGNVHETPVDVSFAALGWIPGTQWFQLFFGSNSDNANAVQFYIDPLSVYYVPEPSTLALAGLGAVGLLMFRRRG